MKVATWNVNSIRARIDRLYYWLKAHRPDVVCIQESKCMDHLFPWKELQLLGYSCAYHGQKSYNGVALLSRHPITQVYKGFTDCDAKEDPQARLIAATIQGVRIISAYTPNGHAVGSDKFRYKLAWLERLRSSYLDVHHDARDDLLLCGDFNVAPHDQDVWDQDLWQNSILTHHTVREAFSNVLDFGLTDTYRDLYPIQEEMFSWWDYSREGFAKNRGVRIDFVLATESMRARCDEVVIDLEERGKTKPSDHAPVMATFT